MKETPSTPSAGDAGKNPRGHETQCNATCNGKYGHLTDKKWPPDRQTAPRSVRTIADAARGDGAGSLPDGEGLPLLEEGKAARG